MKRLIIFALAAAMLAGCAKTSEPDTRAADADAIRAVLAKANEDFTVHNFDGAMKFYASDAALFTPGSGIIQGSDGVRTALTGAFNNPNSTITITPTKIEVARSGELAYAYGTGLTVTTDPATGKKTQQPSKWVTVFKKEADGSWQAVADIFNNDSDPVPME